MCVVILFIISCVFYPLLPTMSQWRTEGGVWGGQTPPPPKKKNSEDTGGDLHRTTKKNRRLDFLL